MSELWDRAWPALHRLLPKGARVLVATSGGPDSQTLLDLIGALAARLELDAVFAAGVNHGLRPEASCELDFACALATAHGVPFARLKVEIASEGNVLNNARRARYHALLAHADTLGVNRIAVAHTANDQAETVLFHLARGAGLVGAGAMRARRGRLVRPLLDVTRIEVLAHLASRNIRFAEDPSNADLRRTRAKLRRYVLPALQEINSGAIKNLARFADRARRAEQTLVRIATRRATRWRGPHDSLQLAACRGALCGRTVAAWLVGRGVRPESRTVSAILALRREGATVAVDHRVVTLCRGHLWLFEPQPFTYGLAIPAEVLIVPLGVTVATHIEVAAPGSDYCTLGSTTRVAFDADALHPTLEIRSVRHGDCVRPFGSQGSSKVGDLFTNIKMPLPLRASWPVVTSDGEIAWIVGLRRSRTAPVTASTLRVLIMEVDGVLPFCPC